MPGRKYTAGSGYRYGFNGQEIENDVNKNNTSAFFWEYDSRIAKRWNIDPKSNSFTSPYSCFEGNPVLFSDPFGDVVKLKRQSDKNQEGYLTKKEFRNHKRKIGLLRENSESFNKVYSDLNNKKEVYTFTLTNESGGGATDNSGFNYKLGMKQLYDGLNLFQSNLSHMAHEFGHAWRSMYRLDPFPPSSPSLTTLKYPPLFESSSQKQAREKSNSSISDANQLAMNEHSYKLLETSKTIELGASHIQNIVLSELIKSQASLFSGIILRSTYDKGYDLIKTTTGGRISIIAVPGIGTYNLLLPPHDKDFYMNNKIDIHKDHEVLPIKKK